MARQEGIPGAGDLAELERLISGYDTALLTTRGTDGHFHTRPMALQKRRLSANELWFVTSLETQKVHDLETDDHCAVAFYGREHSATYVSISGRAELVKDHALIRQMWDPMWKVWFPDGPEEKDIALIKVTPEHAEYVHPETGRLQVLFSYVRSLVTHTRAQPAPKKELDLHH